MRAQPLFHGVVNFTSRHPKNIITDAKKIIQNLNIFKLSVKGLIALDVGSSTGGFTDVLLQNGAEKVFLKFLQEGQKF